MIVGKNNLMNAVLHYRLIYDQKIFVTVFNATTGRWPILHNHQLHYCYKFNKSDILFFLSNTIHGI